MLPAPPDPATGGLANITHKEISFTQVIEADAGHVRRFLIELTQTLETHCIPLEERSGVEIVLAEALNNIVQHAYKLRGGEIEVSMCLKRDGMHFRLCDRGVPLPDEVFPLSVVAALPESDELPEGGFGWFLVDQLARDLVYTRKNGVNHLKFRVAMAVETITSGNQATA